MSTIRVVLKKGKKASSLYLSVSVRGVVALKSLGIDIDDAHWNPSKEIVKSSYPNAGALNKLINQNKAKLIDAEIDLKSNGCSFNSKFLIDYAFKKKDKTYFGYMSEYTKDLKYSTKQSHIATFNHLKRFLGSDFTPDMLDEIFFRKFVSSLRTEGLQDSTIKGYLQSIGAVINFSGFDNCLSRYFLNKVLRLKVSFRHKAVGSNITSALFGWWCSKMIDHVDVVEGKMYFRDLSILRERHVNEEMAVGTFLASYILQGLAPIDLAKLKPSDLIMSENAYVIDTFRQKSGKPVRIVVPSTDESNAILQPFIQSAGEYLFSIVYNGKLASPTLAQFSKRAKILLNKVLKDLNIESSDISLYSARHSYASRLANSGVGMAVIAQAMGRNVSNIATYIKDLTTDDELIQVNKNIKF